MEIPQGTPWKIAEIRTLKRGSSPPPSKRCQSLSCCFGRTYVLSRLDKFTISSPHRLMSRLKSKTTPGDTLSTRPYYCRGRDSKDGSMVMADDENSDFVVNAGEQKAIREPPQIRSPAAENRCPAKIRLGASDKSTAKRQVVNNLPGRL